jgi:hypothetical protein
LHRLGAVINGVHIPWPQQRKRFWKEKKPGIVEKSNVDRRGKKRVLPK